MSLAKTDRVRPLVPLGIHDLLEQSINRSRLCFSPPPELAATTAQISSTSRRRRANKAGHGPQSKEVVQATSQASVLNAASLRASTTSLTSPGGLVDAERTVVPERTKLEYFGASNADKATANHSQSGKTSIPAQVAFATSGT